MASRATTSTMSAPIWICARGSASTFSHHAGGGMCGNNAATSALRRLDVPIVAEREAVAS
ncbi:MAG: hypothetical protein ACXWWQ_04690 [Candidatus Limnocylindria bacterium]